MNNYHNGPLVFLKHTIFQDLRGLNLTMQSNLDHRDHKLDHQIAHVRQLNLFSLTEDFPYLQGRRHL
jgi:hypothetical protein